jgi:four helix bundle protein
VWQKAHEFALDIYRVTANFPTDERFGLTSQFRRAAVSVPANIAEGFRKRSKADKARFMNIAEGSLEECRYYIILSRDLGYANDYRLEHMAGEVSRLLDSYTKRILN